MYHNVNVVRNSAEFIGNKQTNTLTRSLTHTQTDTQLYISTYSRTAIPYFMILSWKNHVRDLPWICATFTGNITGHMVPS